MTLKEKILAYGEAMLAWGHGCNTEAKEASVKAPRLEAEILREVNELEARCGEAPDDAETESQADGQAGA